jgi:hypothetical protein
MPLTKVSFSVIQVANNVTSTTVGNTTSIPSFTFDQNGVITSASNVTPSIANTQITGTLTGSQISSNTVANTNIQTGAIENYLRANTLDFGMRNRIINGAMVIDQRNAGAAITPTNAQYGIDRWAYGLSQASKFTAQQDSSANTVAGFTSSMKITSSSAYSSISSDFFWFEQKVEGLNCSDLGWGSANARPVTLSFWVRSSLTGSFGGSLSNSAVDRSYPFSFTISSANTWEQKTVTIAGDTSGTWLTTNGTGIRVAFNLGSGSDYQGTANTWASAFYLAPTGATSVVGTSGATFYITGVQLEEGSVPTPFEYRQYGQELALCQRYFEMSYPLGTTPGTSSVAGSCWFHVTSTLSGYLYGMIPFKVTKRAIPTMTFYSYTGTVGTASNGNVTNTGTCGINGQVNTQYAAVGNTSGSTQTPDGNNITVHYTASIEL